MNFQHNYPHSVNIFLRYVDNTKVLKSFLRASWSQANFDCAHRKIRRKSHEIVD